VTPRTLSTVLLAVVALTGCGADGQSSALPPGFVDEKVARVEQPTAIALLPDGGMLVTTQQGVVRIVDRRGRLVRRPALDLRKRICTDRERGMTGVAVDPEFAANRRIYLYYTYKKFGGCPTVSAGTPVNRLARFVLARDGTIDPASESVLVDNVPSYGATHNGGDVKFGKDGYLYVAIGDGGRDYARRSSRAETNQASRDRNVLLGKVLRLTSNGQPAPGNPFEGPGTVRCARVGVARPGTICREAYAWGFRNPFRFALDPDTAGVRMAVNDVGQVAWEEVDLVKRGGDHGWPLREGPCQRDGRVRCVPPPPSLTDPAFSYARLKGCIAILAGVFVPKGVWPKRFDGAYLFADFTCGIRMLSGSLEDSPDVGPFSKAIGAISMTFRGSDLYYAEFFAGEIRRIRYVGARRRG
jgi:glucose/arabinose dehydrogenase